MDLGSADDLSVLPADAAASLGVELTADPSLGRGDAHLHCRVTAGGLKVVTA